MSLPLTTLVAEHRELGLIVAVLLGFGFGFTLERAGFGRATKLAGQFYLHDMTVFKVMFSAIVTAMLGTLLAAGLGLVELKALSESVASATYLWPMLIGGLLLGVGFIISGYCPGTSLVSTASGNVDGLFAFSGVIVGSVLYGELFPIVEGFHNSGDLGPYFLYQWLGIPAPVLALGVTLFAIVAFVGADKVERIFAAKRAGGSTGEPGTPARRPRRLVFATLGGAALLALGTMVLPVAPRAAPTKRVSTVEVETLARRLFDTPWQLRVLDLRAEQACAKQRIPGAECVPVAKLDEIGLPYASGTRDLVLVGAGAIEAPPTALAYPGKVAVLAGGFAAWKAYALTKPEPPADNAASAEREAYRFRAAVHSAMTGRPPAPPPTSGVKYVPKPKKKKGGGCS